jgi:hypothetical protein
MKNLKLIDKVRIKLSQFDPQSEFHSRDIRCKEIPNALHYLLPKMVREGELIQTKRTDRPKGGRPIVWYKIGNLKPIGTKSGCYLKTREDLRMLNFKTPFTLNDIPDGLKTKNTASDLFDMVKRGELKRCNFKLNELSGRKLIAYKIVKLYDMVKNCKSYHVARQNALSSLKQNWIFHRPVPHHVQSSFVHYAK